MSCQSDYMINMSFVQWLDYLVRMKEFRRQCQMNNRISYNFSK